MNSTFWFCLVIIVLGTVIVAIPDAGPRVIALSESHGPSMTDLAGLLVILAPWTYMSVHAVRNWRQVLKRLGRKWVSVLLVTAVTGFVLIAYAIANDSNLWPVGAMIAFVGQVVLIAAAFRGT